MHVADLIGIPFAYNGRGNGYYDCYGLLMELFKRRDIILPDHQSVSDQQVIAEMMRNAIKIWQPVADYTPFSAMLIRINNQESHCGMYLGNNKFIHTTESTGGVCIERATEWQRRIKGFYDYDSFN